MKNNSIFELIVRIVFIVRKISKQKVLLINKLSKD